ncbi:hypothetical protein C3L33_21716, partial [Rhododendron williamsianum]
MPVGKLSAGLRSLATASLVGMGEVATKEAFDWVISDPLIVEASGVIGRLMDDVVSHAVRSIEDITSSYMKQYGATEEKAIAEFQKQVTSAWKDNNSECLRPIAVPMPVLLRVFNVARTFHIVYKDADSYTHSGAKFKEIVTSVLVDSVPI